jgi:DNA primase
MSDRNAWINRARAVPIEQVVQRYRIRLKRVGAEHIGPCPRCGGDDRFAVNPAKRLWNCRGCGKGGDVIELVRHLNGCGFVTSVTTLAGPPPMRSKFRWQS